MKENSGSRENNVCRGRMRLWAQLCKANRGTVGQARSGDLGPVTVPHGLGFGPEHPGKHHDCQNRAGKRPDGKCHKKTGVKDCESKDSTKETKDASEKDYGSCQEDLPYLMDKACARIEARSRRCGSLCCRLVREASRSYLKVEMYERQEWLG
jgi:hypothetical protein